MFAEVCQDQIWMASAGYGNLCINVGNVAQGQDSRVAGFQMQKLVYLQRMYQLQVSGWREQRLKKG